MVIFYDPQLIDTWDKILGWVLCIHTAVKILMSKGKLAISHNHFSDDIINKVNLTLQYNIT